MAYTAYRSATTADGFYITLYVEETVGSAAQNTSTLKWYATATTTTSASEVMRHRVMLQVAGDNVSRSFVRPLSAGEVTNLVAPGAARSVTVPHALDGTGSFSMSVTNPGVSILSRTIPLTEIARQTYPSSLPSSVALGASVSLSLIKPLAGSSCTISLKVGSHTEVLVNKTTATSLSVTVPASLLQYCTATPMSCQWIFRTYDSSGNNLGGFVYNKQVTFSYEITLDDPTTEIIPLQAVYTAGYLQGYSQVRVGFHAYPSSEHGGSIASVKISLSDGQSVTRNAASGTWDSATLNVSGTVTITVKATDSRGVTKTKTATISVTAYTPPFDFAFSAERCDLDGTPNPCGDHYAYTISGSVQSIGSNVGQLNVDGTDVGAAAESPSYTLDPPEALAITSVKALSGSITDSFGNVARISTEIPKGLIYMQWGGGTNEKGVSIGGPSTRDMFEVFLPTDFSQTPTVNNHPLGGIDQVWSGTMTSGTITLDGNFSDYKAYIIVGYPYNSSSPRVSSFVPSLCFAASNNQAIDSAFGIYDNDDGISVYCYHIGEAAHMRFRLRSGSAAITRVYGVRA